MKRTKIDKDQSDFPVELREIILGADLYDSSCSPEARVYFADKGKGFYIKSAPKGSLYRESLMDKYFHSKGLGAKVVQYLSLERDWLVTERVCGEDATHALYLNDPLRLAQAMGELLSELHSLPASDCPVKDRMTEYFNTVDEGYRLGRYDASYGDFSSMEEAYRIAAEGRNLLKSDTLIHGDFCLPNFLMDNWQFCGYIDLGNGGIGDRHVDIFWGAWTLNFNLGTDQYREVFFDAYGKHKINDEALRIISAAECFG